MKSARYLTSIYSDTPISLEVHLKLLCEMLDAVSEEDIPAQHQESSADAA